MDTVAEAIGNKQVPQAVFPGTPGYLPPNTPGLVQFQQTVWQGQFPPPDAIERYEVILPGVFDRIVKMAEAQQQAQIVNGQNALSFQRNDIRRAHILAAAVTVAAMVGAVVCAWMKQPYVAAAFLAIPVMSVARALIEASFKRATPAPSPAIVPSPQPQHPPHPSQPQ